MGFLSRLNKYHNKFKIKFTYNSGFYPLHSDISSYKCFIGISLSNPIFFNPSFFQEIVTWCTTNFDNTLLVIGDYLDRYNKEIFGSNNNDAPESNNKASKGELFLSLYSEFLAKIPDGKLSFINWKDTLTNDFYLRARKELDRYSESNNNFQKEIERMAHGYISRKKKQGFIPIIDQKDSIDLSAEYFLEEIAVFMSLVSQGWIFEVYPGSDLKLLRNILKGKYKDAPDSLLQRINIEIHFPSFIKE